MEYFEGLNFFGVLFLGLIPIILLRLFEKSVYWITLVISVGIAIGVFKTQPNHFINLIVFIVETFILEIKNRQNIQFYFLQVYY